MLTLRQKELLDFIRSYCARRGFPPSYDEMVHALDLHSKSGIFRLITALEERGFIRRLPNRARAIELIDPEHEAMKHLRRIINALRASDDEEFDTNFDRAIVEAEGFLFRNELRERNPVKTA